MDRRRSIKLKLDVEALVPIHCLLIEAGLPAQNCCTWPEDGS
jgi:hypothetical protein